MEDKASQAPGGWKATAMWFEWQQLITQLRAADSESFTPGLGTCKTHVNGTSDQNQNRREAI